MDSRITLACPKLYDSGYTPESADSAMSLGNQTSQQIFRI